jgi:hypothetical protein
MTPAHGTGEPRLRDQRLNDLWRLDLVTFVWERLQPNDQTRDARCVVLEITPAIFGKKSVESCCVYSKVYTNQF